MTSGKVTSDTVGMLWALNGTAFKAGGDFPTTHFSIFTESEFSDIWNGSVLEWNFENISREGDGNKTGSLLRKSSPPNGTALILAVTAITVALLALLLNSCLLWALYRVKASKLRPKIFVQTASIANIIVPLVGGFDVTFISALAGKNIKYTPEGTCINGIVFALSSVASGLQTLSTLGLVLDRMYAVAKPITYHTVGYNKQIRVAMSVLPLTIALLMWSCFALATANSFSPPDNPPYIGCYYLFRVFHLIHSTNAYHLFHIISHVLSFVLYVAIFGVLKYQQLRMKAVSDSSKRQNNVSLAITYFLISTSTLCLYLPWPMYPLFNTDNRNRDIRSLHIAKGLHILYYVNSCLDPIVLMTRIRSVRESLPFRNRFKPSTGVKATDRSKSTGISQPTDLL